MRPMRVRMLGAAALAVVALTIPVTRVDAASDIAACSLRASEGTGRDNVGAMLEAVDVLAPDDVWAVGTHMAGPAGTPFAEHWDGTSWNVTRLQLPTGAISMSALYDVKAFAPNDVWAVGTWTGDFPLVEHWDGHRWSLVHVPVMLGTERIMTAVDGTASNDLWMVGQIRVDDQEHGVVLHRTSDGWHVVRAPVGSAVLQGVTMVNGLPTVAGWSIDGSGYARGLVATPTPGGGWTNVDLGPPNGENTFLLGVSVDASGALWAVGFANDSPDDDSARTFRFDGAWSSVPVPEQPGPARLLDVASDDAGTVAVGQTLTDGATHAVVLRLDGGAWSTMSSDAGTGAPDTLSGAAVWHADVWAVGRTVVTGATYGVPAARVYSCG